MSKTAAEQRAELEQKYEALSNGQKKNNAKLSKLNESLKVKINAKQLEERREVSIALFLTDEERITVLDHANIAVMKGPEDEAGQAVCHAANEAIPATELKVRGLLAGIGYVDCDPSVCTEIPGAIIPGLVYRHPACIAARADAENAGAALAAHRAATERAKEQLEVDTKDLDARKAQMLSL